MFHSPKKHFGQHFLVQETVISHILNSMHLQPDDQVIEIGPGRGALTKLLLKKLSHLTIVEIDQDLVTYWQQQSYSNLTIVNEDALKVDFKSFGRDQRIIGNLPYNISSPLLFHFLDAYICIKDMHFMLQKEVVDRLAAVPGTKDYGRLSVMFQACSIVEALFDVGPEAFNPPPKVVSAVVRLVPRCDINFNRACLETLVARSFGMRRKTIYNNLKSWIDISLLERCGIDLKCRPEEISVEQYLALAALLA